MLAMEYLGEYSAFDIIWEFGIYISDVFPIQLRCGSQKFSHRNLSI